MIYIFKCTICETKWERQAKVKEYEYWKQTNKYPKCPRCNSYGIPVVPTVPVHFKGSGFTKSNV